jgi:hypothetical protein
VQLETPHLVGRLRGDNQDERAASIWMTTGRG